MISFTVYGHPEPQGSTKAFLPKGWKRSIITTDNAKLKPWRQQLTRAALEATHGEIPFPKGAAVALSLKFYLARPASVSRRRTFPVVKPDFDKLARAVADGLTGAIYDDDGQIVCCEILKSYGSPERVEIRVAPAGASGEQECSGTARVTLDLFETVAR